MINFSNQSNKECFLHEDLIKKTSWKSVQDCLVTESDPVTFAIAHNYVKTTSFYPNLARVFGLRFISDLPVGASSHASIIMRAPSELLSQLGVVVFEEEKKVCLAASTPFLDKKAMRELFDYLGTEEAELVVAHPSEIKNALQRVFYHEGSVSATERMISMDSAQNEAEKYLSSQELLLLNAQRSIQNARILETIAALKKPINLK
jgi:hypothetical protein